MKSKMSKNVKIAGACIVGLLILMIISRAFVLIFILAAVVYGLSRLMPVQESISKYRKIIGEMISGKSE